MKNTIESVCNLGATGFEVVRDLMKVESWLITLERIFQVMRCTNQQKINFTSFLLWGEACY